LNKKRGLPARIVRRVKRLWNEQQAKRVLRRFDAPYKLNVACGMVYVDGWVNIDINRSLLAVDLVMNVIDGLPFKDASCEAIYSEHFIEHLTLHEGVGFFQECYRVLVPGGVVRTATPDLAYLVDRYTAENWREGQDWLERRPYRFIQSPAEMINVAFRWWGHQWLYDAEELTRRLREAGFMEFRLAEWGKSSHTALQGRETRTESLLILEAVKGQ
jgi:predicted SAM-dependent methyltransferase